MPLLWTGRPGRKWQLAVELLRPRPGPALSMPPCPPPLPRMSENAGHCSVTAMQRHPSCCVCHAGTCWDIQGGMAPAPQMRRRCYLQAHSSLAQRLHKDISTNYIIRGKCSSSTPKSHRSEHKLKCKNLVTRALTFYCGSD